MRIAGASDAGNAQPEPDASWWGARSCVAARLARARRGSILSGWTLRSLSEGAGSASAEAVPFVRSAGRPGCSCVLYTCRSVRVVCVMLYALLSKRVSRSDSLRQAGGHRQINRRVNRVSQTINHRCRHIWHCMRKPSMAALPTLGLPPASSSSPLKSKHSKEATSIEARSTSSSAANTCALHRPSERSLELSFTVRRLHEKKGLLGLLGGLFRTPCTYPRGCSGADRILAFCRRSRGHVHHEQLGALRVHHALGVKSRTAKGRSGGRGCCCTGGGPPGAAGGLHGRTPPPTNRVHLHRWAAPGAGRRPRRNRRGGAASPDEWRGTALIQFN